MQFTTVVDGCNVAYYGQNKEGGKFQISQVCAGRESKRLRGWPRGLCGLVRTPPPRVGDILAWVKGSRLHQEGL